MNDEKRWGRDSSHIKRVGDPPCIKCRHFRITWERERPYSCLHFGFKGSILPALEVRRASGSICRFFTPKRKGTDHVR